jgi:hypothetical protein
MSRTEAARTTGLVVKSKAGAVDVIVDVINDESTVQIAMDAAVEDNDAPAENESPERAHQREVRKKAVDSLMRKLEPLVKRIGSKVRYTQLERQGCASILWGMVHHLNLPTVFTTVSTDEHHMMLVVRLALRSIGDGTNPLLPANFFASAPADYSEANATEWGLWREMLKFDGNGGTDVVWNVESERDARAILPAALTSCPLLVQFLPRFVATRWLSMRCASASTTLCCMTLSEPPRRSANESLV